MTIETRRLQLRPIALGHLLALIEGPRQFEEQFGLSPAKGFGAFITSGEVSPTWLDLLRSSTEPDPWVFGFAVVDRESNTVVGTGGFKGPPDEEGTVEIAYGIVPSYEGRGYATETAAALVAFARNHRAVRLIRAHTLPTNVASARVLEKCGFRRIRVVMDPDDGLVWRFEIEVGPPSTTVSPQQ